MPNLNGHAESIKNSQFKAAWQSGPTRTIRVPIALADITLEYARKLDRGIEPRDTAQLSDIETDGSNSEPRDTEVVSDSQADNPIDVMSSEPRDTAKIEAELEDARADYAKLLESSTHVTNKLKEEVQKLRSQLEKERADREETLPDAAIILSQLRGKRKKSTATLADIEAILEMIE
ncbi:hypothetical protein QUA03_27365 [Microcoleus sp. S36b_A4]|uniref:hypothetical protein n=1 Tax=Microcoleus sp. S36b_A4 TaxID=3055420 RepID=UPI002FCFD95A